jgi:hypothetical protein
VISSLISRMVLTLAGDRLEVLLYGDLAQILAISEAGAANKNGPTWGGGAVIVGGCGDTQPPLPNYNQRPLTAVTRVRIP